RKVKVGDQMDAATELRPMSSKDALETLTRQVEEAVKNGATLHVGGKPLESKGNFFAPTILTHITRDNPAYFEKFFGPVAQMYVVKDDDDAVKLANDSHYGLGGAGFSQNIARAKRIASRIETVMVYSNVLTDTSAELPVRCVK
ncbi:aldehyde dehydrogenase family protein, partial [Salmonella enterica]|uniref:aldehyde dehydrogenase family protein n=1 Tax=Salmonella enterica TaxID=28901 RepID=UPI00398C2AC4